MVAVSALTSCGGRWDGDGVSAECSRLMISVGELVSDNSDIWILLALMM